MQNHTKSLYPNITLNDVQLAAAYYPILIDLAKHKHRLTYGELVDRAKKEYPDKKEVQNAIAVSTGRKLDVVRLFTSERGLPDVTSLIINKKKGECGPLYTEHFDPEKSRTEVYQYNWEEIATEFDLYIDKEEKNKKPRKRIKKSLALELMSNYYSENKEQLPPSIKKRREDIILLLMEGYEVEDCFYQALNKT